ncbi:hypothetical protein FOZ61_010666 [Perkinsus olseni]|uniref:Uncharacterized protein n=1 Tax=Perkinsus olseni TaxID=32597 RepID=A0A7J6KXC0_PEROL|nr:hypothetical protein FOZ61_010666 [Perkinsus olseni]
MVHHTSIILLLLLATAPCSVASTAAMAKDTTDSATCSLSFTYTKDNTETKVIVGDGCTLPRARIFFSAVDSFETDSVGQVSRKAAPDPFCFLPQMAMMLPPPAAAEEGKKEEFYAELTYVSIAEERQFVTYCQPTPQKDGMIIHYFNLHDLDARYHDVWDPSLYGNKRATENKCKKYIKAIGNEQLRRHHATKLDDEWKNITITKPARDKPLLVRTFARKDVSADGDVNKALFAIAHEALDRYYAGTSNEVVALQTSSRGFFHRQAVHMNAKDGGKLDGMSSQSVLNME